MAEPYRKPPLTFDQQLDRLEGRGLVIADREQAEVCLRSISYYRLSAYWYPFRAKDAANNITDRFEPGTVFEDGLRLYEFDRRLRLLVIDAIERVEVYIRTLLTYHFGHQYGAFGHTDAGNFHPEFWHAEWIAKMESEASRSSDQFIRHYRSKYTGFPTLPIWMLTEIMSLGSLSICYKGLKHADKKVIAAPLGLHYRRLVDWLHKLTYIRNVCAHHSRLWNRELAVRPERTGNPDWNPPLTPRNDRIFYILLILRYLLKTTDNGDAWAEQCNELIQPLAAERRWRAAMGLPDNWLEHPVWVSR